MPDHMHQLLSCSSSYEQHVTGNTSYLQGAREPFTYAVSDRIVSALVADFCGDDIALTCMAQQAAEDAMQHLCGVCLP